MLLSVGTCSQHKGHQCRLPQPEFQYLGLPDPSPPFLAPPSAPSPSMTVRWRALSTMSSILGQAAPQRLAAASPVGGPTMWMQVWAPQGLTQSKGSPEPFLPPQFTWRFSHRLPHCRWHYLASCLLVFQRRPFGPKKGAEARGWAVTEWAAEPTGMAGGKQRPLVPCTGAVTSSSKPPRTPLGISIERLPQLCGLYGLKQFLKLGTADIWDQVILWGGASCALWGVEQQPWPPPTTCQ